MCGPIFHVGCKFSKEIDHLTSTVEKGGGPRFFSEIKILVLNFEKKLFRRVEKISERENFIYYITLTLKQSNLPDRIQKKK